MFSVFFVDDYGAEKAEEKIFFKIGVKNISLNYNALINYLHFLRKIFARMSFLFSILAASIC
jgi:hypothetical protein